MFFCFTAQRYTSAVYAVVVCPSVCLSICLSQAGKNFAWLSSRRYRPTARIAPKICQGQPPTMYSKCSRFHPNRFGGVIAERVNTAKTRRKVSAIFA